jgi:hypothetical protein
LKACMSPAGRGATIYFGYEIYISETSILTQKHVPA